jgi:hypothetical protein
MDRFRQDLLVLKSASFRLSSFIYQVAQTSHCRFKGVTENETGPTSSAQGNITNEQILELPAHLIGTVCVFRIFSSYGIM